MPILDALRRITQCLNEATDLDQALTHVVHGVKAHLAVDACSVYLSDASETCFVLMATGGFDPRAVGLVRFGPGEGLVGLVIERQRPINLSNAQDIRAFATCPSCSGNAPTTPSLACPSSICASRWGR